MKGKRNIFVSFQDTHLLEILLLRLLQLLLKK